jgi:DNA primase
MDINNIAEILKQCGIDYKEKSNYFIFQCLNPTHDDHDPSMRLYASSGIAHCFSCGYNLHINQIYKKFLGKDLDLNKYKYDYNKVKTKKVKEKVIGKIIVQGEILSIYNNDQAYQYAKLKGLSKEFVEFFNVKSIKMGTMQVEGYKEIKLYNRLLFPIEENHKIVSIEARDYTGRSSKKLLYPEGSSVSSLYGIDYLDFSKPLNLVEGIKSLWKVWSIDHNSTSKFNNLLRDKQRELLVKFPEITLLPDNDEAGTKLLNDLADLMKEHNKPLYIAMPEKHGYDPNDLTIDEIKKILDKKKLVNEWDLEQTGCFKPIIYNQWK